MPSTASKEEIRRAYKRLVRRYHPDLNPLNLQAEEAFKRIQAAYEFLSQKEAILQQPKTPASQESEGSFISTSPVKKSLNKKPKRKKKAGVYVHSQKLDRGRAEACKKCAGRGQILILRGAHRWTKTCDRCGGKGNLYKTF